VIIVYHERILETSSQERTPFKMYTLAIVESKF